MSTLQAVTIVTLGTLVFQIADIGKSVYVRGRDVSQSQRINNHKSAAEIDRSNRELAQNHAFLHNNPKTEEPTSHKLSQTPPIPKH
jgi:formylmethanofuran dehydrogenase subunit E